MVWWGVMLIGIGATLIGGLAGWMFARHKVRSELKSSPIISEKQVRAMFNSMGKKPSEKQVRGVINSMKNADSKNSAKKRK